MINLLPDDTKKDIRAARANVILLRYNFLTLIAIGLLGCISALFYVVMHNTQSTAVTTTQDNSALAASFEPIRKNADEYRTNLSIASQILKNSTDYTNIVMSITKLLPTGVVMDNITVNSADFGKPTTLSAHVKTFEKATELKQSFESSKLFTNVHLQNVTNDGDTTTVPGYPISVSIAVQVNKESGEQK